MQGLAPVFVGDDLLLVNKPGGLLSVPGRGPDKQDCAIHRVQQHYPEALIVHRLDQATSGLLLLARGPAMQRCLSLAFAERRVHKGYEALLQGHLPMSGGSAEWQTVDLPLQTDWPNRPRQKIDFEHGKPSQTRYRLLGHEGPNSRVLLEPLTGRTHQLRVHMLALGHPIVGDTLYSGPQDQAPAAELPGLRMCLHARSLHLPDWGLQIDCPPEF
ncbi:tRNA pseudouridine32 synthase/23S rRNA pseudouridine746 synthase [Paucibacter oligotrophus]|uniref:Dual-specificity RNA pseudouridine synthase RluA n=1 Tax=Roseateles oligotrophus TaxID=1769250 RepID=A0A840LF28_9BURK|nr:RluA family pseudouridine synthase [Roseateles oligotrophus]MBB4843907.1 tRNA pseudouridine32 synthase/23S rRNA pseudouridine746 synthase [Roseateles oligotrophus]